MKIKLIVTWIGNLIDAVATIILTQRYGFLEINPFMAWFLKWPVLAMICKIVAITGVLIYIYHKRSTKYVDALASFAAALYGGLGVYYICLMTMVTFV